MARGQLVIAPDEAELIGRRLRCWRILHDVGTREMAQALGTGKSGLSRIEHARRPLTVAMARDIERLTGMALDGRGASMDDKGELCRTGQSAPSSPTSPS